MSNAQPTHGYILSEDSYGGTFSSGDIPVAICLDKAAAEEWVKVAPGGRSYEKVKIFNAGVYPSASNREKG